MIKCPGGGLTVNDRMTIIRVQPCPDTGKKGEADMFIPELKTEIIDPEDNVRFIQRFLSREMQENTTRPFYEKTIFLYPELKKIADIPDEKEREMFIREAVLKRLTD
ncbi:MAG: hypothetical protein J6Z35_09390, partial [Lachnospiraceae bacterium]|nr:hypothetical protein [Lachnospiraceae bacterium]